jgi:folylpolyglutamate synthase/dihydropteroate synthase
MSTEKLEDFFWETGIPVRTEATIKSAIDRALIQTPQDGIVLITGSLFVVAEAREYLLEIDSG